MSNLHQPFHIVPADAEVSKLIYDERVDVFDFHETKHSPDSKDVTIQREAKYLAHHLVFQPPTRVGRHLLRELFGLGFGTLLEVNHDLRTNEVALKDTVCIEQLLAVNLFLR